MSRIDDVYDAVEAGFRTSATVALATGIPLRLVSAYLTVLRRRGEIQVGRLLRHPSSVEWRGRTRRKPYLRPRGRGGCGFNVYTITSV